MEPLAPTSASTSTKCNKVHPSSSEHTNCTTVTSFFFNHFCAPACESAIKQSWIPLPIRWHPSHVEDSCQDSITLSSCSNVYSYTCIFINKFIYTQKSITPNYVTIKCKRNAKILCEQIARQSWWAQQYTGKLPSNASPSIGLAACSCPCCDTLQCGAFTDRLHETSRHMRH